MINVGVIGSGFIVPEFIKATQAVKGYHYRGIASPVEEQLIKMKETYGFDYYSLNNEDVFSDPKVDIIYLAVPNSLHYPLAKEALKHNKHVIVEKPFTPSYKQAKELIDLAKKKKKIIFDAVTLVHMPNYNKIKDLVKELGEIKMVNINFSQYSSRYNKLKQGIVLPAFDPKFAGGACMDLGIYNINFVTGIFGEPKSVTYFSNKLKNIDSSGILILDYKTFKVTAIAAKDCKAPLNVCIQGDKGYVQSPEASSVLTHVKHVDNEGKEKVYTLNSHPEYPHYHEYKVLKELVNTNNLKQAQEYNKHTLLTVKVLEKALKSANIEFK